MRFLTTSLSYNERLLSISNLIKAHSIIVKRTTTMSHLKKCKLSQRCMLPLFVTNLKQNLKEISRNSNAVTILCAQSLLKRLDLIKRSNVSKIA